MEPTEKIIYIGSWGLVIALIIYALMCFSLMPFENNPANIVASFKYSNYGDFSAVLSMVNNRNPYGDAQGLGFTANYPPFAFLLFYPLARLASIGGEFNFSNFYFIATMALYLLPCLLALSILFYKAIPYTAKLKLPIMLALLTSYPIYFCIIRMNNNLVAAVFFFWYFCWYDDDNNKKRYLSLLFLSIAGSIKLYPLFFGVLLIKEKRWNDCLIVASFAIIITFISFTFFAGGLYNIELFANQLFLFVNKNLSYFNMNDITFTKLLRGVFILNNLGISTELMKCIRFINYLLFIVSCIALFGVKNQFKFTALSIATFLNFTDMNYTYSLVFLFPAIIALMRDGKYCNIKQNEYYFWLSIVALIISHIVSTLLTPFFLIAIGLVCIRHNYDKKPVLIVLGFAIYGVILYLTNAYYVLSCKGPIKYPYVHQMCLASTLLIIQLIIVSSGFTVAVKCLVVGNKGEC